MADSLTRRLERAEEAVQGIGLDDREREAAFWAGFSDAELWVLDELNSPDLQPLGEPTDEQRAVFEKWQRRPHVPVLDQVQQTAAPCVRALHACRVHGFIEEAEFERVTRGMFARRRHTWGTISPDA
jgi:hypothetical protein